MGFIVSLIVAIIIGWIGSLFVKGSMPGGIIGSMIAGLIGAWIGHGLLGTWASPCRLCHHSGNHRSCDRGILIQPDRQKQRIKKASSLMGWGFFPVERPNGG